MQELEYKSTKLYKNIVLLLFPDKKTKLYIINFLYVKSLRLR